MHFSVPRAVRVTGFAAPPPITGKTDMGQDCVFQYPPRGLDSADIVDHAFSATADVPPPLGYTLTYDGSFSEPQTASGTLRITSADAWYPARMEPRIGSVCDSGSLSWTASCVVEMPDSPCLAIEAAAPTFSGSRSGAKVSANGAVTVPIRVGCPRPGDDCQVSVAAKRRKVMLGRSEYVVKAGRSAKTRFKLTAKGRRLLRRLGRVRAKVGITVTRAGAKTEKTVTVRMKANDPR